MNYNKAINLTALRCASSGKIMAALAIKWKQIILNINDELDEVITESREKFFPMNLPENITARCVGSKELFDVYNKHINEIFPSGSFDNELINEGLRARAEKRSPLKKRHQLLHFEHILFFNELNAPIGWMFGESQDQSTFYMRNTAFLKEYQNKGIYTAFLKELLEYIKYIGYEKVVSHHLGTNKAVLIPKLKLGFDICGLELHETIGANVKLVHMLHEDRKSVYHHKYGK